MRRRQWRVESIDGGELVATPLGDMGAAPQRFLAELESLERRKPSPPHLKELDLGMNMKIGKVIRFMEIRHVWKKENDFSDWLVTEDGAALLAEELGLEIENLTRESRPGDAIKR